MKLRLDKKFRRAGKRWFFLALLLVLVLVRVWMYRMYWVGWKACLFSDSAAYAILARRFLRGDFWGAIHPVWNVGFPLFTALFYGLTASWEKAELAVSVVSAVLLIVVSFWFLKRWSVVLALAAAFITAFAASFEILVVREGITEPLYILFMWLGVTFGWLALSRGFLKFWALCGLWFGLAFLVRTDITGILGGFVFIAVVKWFLELRKDGRWVLKRGLVRMAVFFGVFFLVILPYAVVISEQLGRFTISAKYALVGAPGPLALDKERQSTVFQDVDSVDFLNKDSLYFDPNTMRQVLWVQLLNGSLKYFSIKGWSGGWERYREYVGGDMFGRIGMILVGVGFLFGLLKRETRKLTLYLGWLFLVGMVWMAVFMAPNYRYMAFAFPFFYVSQAIGVWVGILVVVKLISSGLPMAKRLAGEKVMAVIVLGILSGFWTRSGGGLAAFRVPIETARHCDYRVIGEWLKSQGISLVGTTVEAIPFYADARYVYRPAATPEEIVNYFKEWGVEYVVMNMNEAGYDVVRPFADPNYKNPDLTLLKQFSEDGSLVWKVRLTDEERKDNMRTRLGYN